MGRPVKADNERVSVPRLSITITPAQRKAFRITAAIMGLEVGQWAVGVLEQASETAIKRIKA